MAIQMVIGDIIRTSARRLPDKLAVVFRGKRFTYGQLNDRVNRLANGINKLGFKQGDRISILLYNCNEYIEILFALAKLGITAVPVNFRFVGSEIEYIVNNSESQFLIYGEEFQPNVHQVKDNFEFIGPKGYLYVGTNPPEYAQSYEEFLKTNSPEEAQVDVTEEDTFYFGYTSGTTGFPKGAVRSHRCNYTLFLAVNATFGLSEEDLSLLIMPLFHSNSIWFALAQLMAGGTIYIYPSGRFNPREILEIIAEEKVTFSSLVPTMYTLIFNLPDKEKYDTNSLRILLTSSAPLMTKTKEEILAFFKHVNLFEGYGATESGLVTTLRPKDQFRKVRCCGQASIGVAVKILSPDGNEVEPGVVGELFSRSPYQFEGYYKMPETNRDAFRGEWFSAGDMATYDNEGYYYIVDRKKDMIISGGENIYPTEIDDILSKHPKVLEAAVIGVPDEKWGEAVKAVVILKKDAQATAEELIRYCKDRLAGYKVPKSVDFVTEVPKSPTGKILKRQIREAYWKDFDVKI